MNQKILKWLTIIGFITGFISLAIILFDNFITSKYIMEVGVFIPFTALSHIILIPILLIITSVYSVVAIILILFIIRNLLSKDFVKSSLYALIIAIVPQIAFSIFSEFSESPPKIFYILGLLLICIQIVFFILFLFAYKKEVVMSPRTSTSVKREIKLYCYIF